MLLLWKRKHPIHHARHEFRRARRITLTTTTLGLLTGATLAHPAAGLTLGLLLGITLARL